MKAASVCAGTCSALASGMTDAIACFIASGDQVSFRIPYLTLEHPTAGIFPRLGELSERSKALYMVACIRHAWDQHVTYDVGSTLPIEVLALVDALLEGTPCSAAEMRAQLEAFQKVHGLIVDAAQAGVQGAVTAANLTHVLGALAAWIYHALFALTRDPALTWAGYSMARKQWLPFWLVLSGTASSDPGERAWQIEVLRGFVDRPSPEIDPTDPAWLRHQMEIGQAYFTLCVAPWDLKCSLVENHPDVVDPVRRSLAKLVMRTPPGRCPPRTTASATRATPPRPTRTSSAARRTARSTPWSRTPRSAR